MPDDLLTIAESYRGMHAATQVLAQATTKFPAASVATADKPCRSDVT